MSFAMTLWACLSCTYPACKIELIHGKEFVLSFVPAVSLEWLDIKHILCQLSASTKTAA